MERSLTAARLEAVLLATTVITSPLVLVTAFYAVCAFDLETANVVTGRRLRR